MNVLANSLYGPIIINTNDKYITKQILQTGTWAKSDQTVISAILEHLLHQQHNVTCYDVGANNGIHTLFMAKKFNNSVNIRAFEAQKVIFQMLCGTIALNNLNTVSCHLNAVADKTGDTFRFTAPDYTVENNFGGVEIVTAINSDNYDLVRGTEEHEVSSVTIDSFNENVGFIKLDIEGMELSALKGASAALTRYKPVVLCELIKSDRRSIISFMKQFGYSVFQNATDGLFVPDSATLATTTLQDFGYRKE